jgi:hypothetical protein
MNIMGLSVGKRCRFVFTEHKPFLLVTRPFWNYYRRAQAIIRKMASPKHSSKSKLTCTLFPDYLGKVASALDHKDADRLYKACNNLGTDRHEAFWTFTKDLIEKDTIRVNKFERKVEKVIYVKS